MMPKHVRIVLACLLLLGGAAIVPASAAQEEKKPTPPPDLSAKDLEGIRKDLISDDAALAYKAICKMIASPKQSMPFLKDKLPPAPPLDGKRLSGYIADLESKAFAAREKAMRELEKMGLAA